MDRFLGVIIGFCTLIIIGAFHPIVIKFEYHLGRKFWPLFLAAGIALLVVSVLEVDHTVSALAAILGCTCLWSIREVFEQAERVRQGRFPRNPKRSY